MVDASQNIIVKEDDCHSVHYKIVNKADANGSFDEKFEDRIYSHTLAHDVNQDGKILLEAGTIIDKRVLKIINDNNIDEVAIRSVLTCETEG